MDLSGHYQVIESVVAFERDPPGTLLKKEENYGYRHTRWLHSKLGLLGDESDEVWIGPISLVGEAGDVNHYMAMTRVFNGKFISNRYPLNLFSGMTGPICFETFDNGHLTMEFDPDCHVIKVLHTDRILSILDDGIVIKVIWDLRLRKLSRGEGNFPVILEHLVSCSATPEQPLTAKRKLPRCRGCGERTKGHLGAVGMDCIHRKSKS